jgi:hypothetical protein
MRCVAALGLTLLIAAACGRICTDGHYSEIAYTPVGVFSAGWRTIVAARETSTDPGGDRFVIRAVQADGSPAELTKLPSIGAADLDGAAGYYSSLWWPRPECSAVAAPHAVQVIVDDISGLIRVHEIAVDAVSHAAVFDGSVYQVLWVDAGGTLRQRAIDENGDLWDEQSLGRVTLGGTPCLAVQVLARYQLFVRVADAGGTGYVLFVIGDGIVPQVDRVWTPPPGWQFAQASAQLVFAGELHVKGVSSAGVTEVAIIEPFSRHVRMQRLGEASDFAFALPGLNRIHALTTLGLMVELEPSYVVARQFGVAPLAGVVDAPFALLGGDITYLDAVPLDRETQRAGHLQLTRLRNPGEAVWRIDAYVDSPVLPTRVCRATGTAD